MKETPLIELSNVKVQFGSFVVHRDINFSVRPAEVVTLLGPSGSGKTIILKLIMGLLFPTGGKVTILGKDTNKLDESQLRHLRLQIGMLFQGAALFDSMTVFDNIAYSLREEHELPEVEITKIVKDKLQIIGLPEIGQKFPPQLSGGQKKRVGLARALASSPKVMLFDEPTTGLDPTATRLINELIIRLKKDYGITCIVVTHDIASAKEISDRWLLLNQGKIAADGPVEDLIQNNRYIKSFITGQWSDIEEQQKRT